MNKKAIIGTGLTWIVATTLIAFVLVVYLVATSFIFTEKAFASDTLTVSQVGAGLDLTNTKNLISFLNKNGVLISEWVDDDFVLDHGKWLSGERDNKEIIICERFEDIKEVFDFTTNSIYFKSGAESIIVQDSGKEIVCTPDINPIGFDKESKIKSRINFLSERGNKVEAIYYER